ncbi:MAG: hypothetical protein A2Z99_00170 [Treponema sp. GWB1_62_6]|nr:MAG: hypothetical protein A2Y36_06390 [Treponema sp. GWA1_62_8]OHE63315.1 MAG: hypothetical protein A2001_11370 [Treponema sp. GWC1_61_84]OHE64484.1 MAG: hypothetical protein A2Z99_00170 [Treponema sp. GWB1_62_6]OHE69185.1 MAG: hypothetical protein A2413_09130 [Treponema sp. RIFOXYC1_FULL_61_9]HCM26309.1 hypothetical protein [Treponema sp.]
MRPSRVSPTALIRFALLCAALSSCASRPGTPALKTLKLGVLVPRSGFLAPYAAAFVDGILCREEMDTGRLAAKGLDVELVFFDTKSDLDRTVAGCGGLIGDEGVIAILGPLDSKSTAAAIKVSEVAGVPIVPLWATKDDLTKGTSSTFRVVLRNADTGRLLAKFGAENLRAKKAAVIYDDVRAEFKDGFVKSFGELTSGEVRAYRYPLDAASCDDISGLAPDVVFVIFADAINNRSQIKAVISELEDRGVTAAYLGDTDWSAVDPAELAGSIRSEVYYLSHFSPDAYDEGSRKFSEAFERLYGKKPDGMAALGFEAASLVYGAIADEPAIPDATRLAKALRGRDYTGLLGRIKMGANGDAEKSAVIMRIGGGESGYVTTIKPEAFKLDEFKEKLGTAATSGPKKDPLAVMRLDDRGIGEEECAIISELVASALARTGRFQVIETSQRDKIFQEVEFSLSGLSDEATRLEVGKLLNARHMLSGSVGSIAGKSVLNVRLIAMESGATLNALYKIYPGLSALIDDCENFTYELISAAIAGE